MLKSHRGFTLERNIGLSACVSKILSLSRFLYTCSRLIRLSTLTCCLYMWLPAQILEESRSKMGTVPDFVEVFKQ